MICAFAGSGKKYKKCCMNKKEITIVTPADIYIEKALKDYPKEELLKYYDAESVQIDEKLYQVLKHKAIPLWVNRNYQEEARRNIKNMKEALELIKIKCQKEKIKTVQEFDEKIAIHYNFNDIINKYFEVIDKNKRAFFEDKQNQKTDFIIQISQIINMDIAWIKFYTNLIIEEYFDDDDIIENAEEIIYKLKEQFPDMEKFFNIKLSKVYQEDICKIEKTLEPIEESIKKCGTDEELEIRKIEIYYEYALFDYYQEEQQKVEIYQKLWLLVKDFINANKIETEDEYNKKQEPEYFFDNILYRIDRFYENEPKYINQRIKILKEASKIMQLNEDSKEIIATGLATLLHDECGMEENLKRH